MTRENFTRWTCNSCGAIEEMANEAERSKWPKGWRGYGFTAAGVPEASKTDVIGHLCRNCAELVVNDVTDYDRHLTMPELPPTQPDDRVGQEVANEEAGA